jgi:hypothetical protein
MKIDLIAVPHNWTAAKDIQAVIEEYGESKYYFESPVWHISESYNWLELLVDRALDYFGSARKESIVENIGTLRLHLLTKTPSDIYLKRCVEALEFGEIVAREASGLRGVHYNYKALEMTWFLTFIALTRGLDSIAHALDEFVPREYPEFNPEFSDPPAE